MPRWPNATLSPTKSKLKAALPKPAARKPVARKAAARKAAPAKMLQIGDVHVVASTVLAIEGTGPLTCRIYTEKFSVMANVAALVARQAIDTNTPVLTWATPEAIFEAETEMRARMQKIAEAAKPLPGAEPGGEPEDGGPVLQ